MALVHYRYRTPALTGPWRDTADQAIRDALNAKQAVVDEDDPANIRWIVPGQIEEEGVAERVSRRQRR